MAFYRDQLGREIEISKNPQRIISLVPSQTELLHALGLHDEVIGITKFCIHPDEWFRSKTRIGGTKQLHLDKIKELEPDLVIANKEENVRGQVEELSKNFPVWISDVNNLDDAIQMIESIGEIVERPELAHAITLKIKDRFQQLNITKKIRAAYLIWNQPYMTIGHDTFIHDMMSHAGFENIFGNQLRYPEITTNKIADLDCEVLLLSSEPFPFKQKHIDELQPLLPNTKIILVDGEMFSWYGSRLLKAAAYFQQLRAVIG